jgi:hypothetical protein
MHKFFLVLVFLALMLASITQSSAQTSYRQYLPAVLKEGTKEVIPEPTASATRPNEPSATATSEPTATRTSEPSATATSEPTATATSEPTATRTSEPTATVTSEPTATRTSEPTATVTSEPTTTPVTQYIPNGGFEQGELGWTLNGPSIPNNPAEAYSGARYALLGGSGTQRQTMSIVVTVPSEAPYLSFWSKVSSEVPSCLEDAGYIWVDPDPTDSEIGEIVFMNFDFCSSNQYDYLEERVDLSKYAGASVELEFVLSTTTAYHSFWSIDNLNFSN